MTKAIAARLTSREYKRLLEELRSAIEEGRRRADEAVAQELVRTYHRVGRSILEQQLSGRAGYGSSLIQRLADDLGLHSRVLHQSVAFARCYPEPPDSGLRWTHYRELIGVADDGQRRWYEEQAEENGWTRAKLVEAIRRDRFSDRADAEGGDRAGGGALRRPSAATYVYKANVERVIDGDTLLVIVDLGFQVLKRQRVRLAAIDTPALETKKGARARDVVQEELASVEFVMIKTQKIDLYGRYVAHVFYKPGERDKQAVFAGGRYLNQLLVDRGLATPLT